MQKNIKAQATAAKPTKLKLLSGADAINKAIDSIATRGKKLDRDIWVAAVSAMQHHATHGDVTLVNRLVESMPKGSRVNALRDFILAHGAVQYSDETKAFVHDKEGNFDLDGACMKPWTEYKPEPEYKPYDAMAELAKVIKTATDVSGKREVTITDEQRNKLLKLAKEMGVEV